MICCGAGTTFAFSDFLFCIVFGFEFFDVGFDFFYLLPLVARWLRVWIGEIMVGMKSAVSPLPERSMWPMRCQWYRSRFAAVLVVYGSLRCRRNLCFLLGVYSLWAEATCSGVFLSAVCTVKCPYTA